MKDYKNFAHKAASNKFINKANITNITIFQTSWTIYKAIETKVVVIWKFSKNFLKQFEI